MSESPPVLAGVGNEVLLVLVVAAAMTFLVLLVLRKMGDSETETPLEARPRSGSRETWCSVCLDEPSLAVETNCGHVFCARCLMHVYQMQSQGPLSAPKCPYCRTRVTLVLPTFTQTERETQHEQREEVERELRAFNRRFSGVGRSWLDQLRDAPMLLRHLWHLLWSGEGTHLLFRLRMYLMLVVCVSYIILPFDLMPEGFFGILGLLDDIMVAMIMLIVATAGYRDLLGQEGFLG